MTPATGSQRRTGDFANGIRCYSDLSIAQFSAKSRVSAKSRDALARAKECEVRVDRMLSDLQRPAEGPSPLLPTKRGDDVRFERPKC